MATDLAKIYLPGRYQQIQYQGTEFIIDVSHNPAAVEALAQFLKDLPTKPIYAIFGIKASKDIDSIISIMQDLIDEWYLLPVEGAGKMSAETLAQYFKTHALQAHLADNLPTAIQTIIKNNLQDKRIVIFGSFHIAGPALEFVGIK